ncbi:alpha/beta-hydrolase [Dentipellis sp. KUC8613]|nr:alpha/beta-hydrolase [Dentipellis sp. KUC8613]
MARLQLIQTLLVAVAGVRAAAVDSPYKRVDLGYATYQSNVHLDEGVTSFLGVRYAAPPTGNLRFSAPQFPATVQGVQNATTQPQGCLQHSMLGSFGMTLNTTDEGHSLAKRADDGSGNEDCLFLNVHVPDTPSSQGPLPVIVWIHGGGYDGGNVSIYPAQDFVKESNFSVVSVNIQYRLGLFGFLGGQKIKDGGALNAGLLDQEFALKWVQTYISKFGGDPTKVSLYGESAGAGSEIQHMIAHGGKTDPPLFRAVVANSPFLPSQYDYNDTVVEAVYSAVVAGANCTNSADTLACLRSADATALSDLDQAIATSNFLGVYTFVPVVDGDFIRERPTVALLNGPVNGEALIVSTNSHEGTLFASPQAIAASNITLAEYVAGLFPRLSQAQIETAVSLYSNIGLSDVPDQASTVMAESIFVCPSHYMIAAFGERAWKAEYAIPPGLHGDDLSYEFSTFSIPPTFNNSDFITAFQQGFLNVVRSLDPNTKAEPTIAPNWPNYSDGQSEMLFNRTDDAQPEPVVRVFETDESQLQRCQFWSSVTAATVQ